MMPVSKSSGDGFSRRRFLASTSALGAVPLVGLARLAGAAAPPETTKVRILYAPAICLGPEFLAEEFLRLEGFSEVEYVPMTYGERNPSLAKGLAEGQADFTMETAAGFLPVIDAGPEIVLLTGIHAGCLELFGGDRVRALRDLKGKTLAIIEEGSPDQLLLSGILAYVGINPRTEVKWLAAKTYPEMVRAFSEGKADAILAFPPQPQELRALKLGKVILNTTQDRPWSQYFCCMVGSRREYVQKHPVATKRVLRAFLKATELCAREPERAARLMVSKGFEPRYEIALEVLKQLPYSRWRDFDPEDTVRFLGLRLHEVGLIKSTPQKLIAQGTDWQFLNELKREMKA